MTDTVTKLMALADMYALQLKFDLVNEMNGKPTEAAPSHRQALQDELVRLFTPLTDEQIKGVLFNYGYDADDSQLLSMIRFIEWGRGITGESK